MGCFPLWAARSPPGIVSVGLIGSAVEWFECLDPERAELISTEHSTTDLTRRYVDMPWKVPVVRGRRAGTHLYVVVILESRSRVDRNMALRMHGSAIRVYKRLWNDPRSRKTRWLVSIPPFVVYNGLKHRVAPYRNGLETPRLWDSVRLARPLACSR